MIMIYLFLFIMTMIYLNFLVLKVQHSFVIITQEPSTFRLWHGGTRVASQIFRGSGATSVSAKTCGSLVVSNFVSGVRCSVGCVQSRCFHELNWSRNQKRQSRITCASPNSVALVHYSAWHSPWLWGATDVRHG